MSTATLSKPALVVASQNFGMYVVTYLMVIAVGWAGGPDAPSWGA